MDDPAPQYDLVCCVFLMLVLPGICSLCGMIWLDITTRYVKEAHYLYLLEIKINKLFHTKEGLNWEHYLYEKTKNKTFFFRTNHLYYYMMLGFMFVCYIMVIFIAASSCDILDIPKFYIVMLVILMMTTVFFCRIYIKEIRSYWKEKRITEQELIEKNISS